MTPVALRTSRLVLDQPGEEDVDRIAEYCTDPVFEHWLTTPWPYTRADAEGFVRGFVPDGWAQDAVVTWAIRSPERGFVGVVGISLARPDRPAGELGFWLGAPHRGCGFVPEAAATAMSWVFEQRLVDRIEWDAVIPNRSSLEVARKLGFRYLGERVAQAGFGGEKPLCWYGELRASDHREPKPGWP